MNQETAAGSREPVTGGRPFTALWISSYRFRLPSFSNNATLNPTPASNQYRNRNAKDSPC